MIEKDKRIKTKKMLKEWLTCEKSYYRCRLFQRLLFVSEKAILRRHQILLRKTEYYTNSNRMIRANIYKVLLLSLQNRYTLHIPINCCGEGLHIMHLGPILINNQSSVGNNCSIHINTAIVANGINNGAPSIGDGVVIGVGAVLLGKIEIAKNIAVGANSVVNKSFKEENITIAGVPARKISETGALNWNQEKTSE